MADNFNVLDKNVVIVQQAVPVFDAADAGAPVSGAGWSTFQEVAGGGQAIAEQAAPGPDKLLVVRFVTASLSAAPQLLGSSSASIVLRIHTVSGTTLWLTRIGLVSGHTVTFGLPIYLHAPASQALQVRFDLGVANVAQTVAMGGITVSA